MRVKLDKTGHWPSLKGALCERGRDGLRAVFLVSCGAVVGAVVGIGGFSVCFFLFYRGAVVVVAPLSYFFCFVRIVFILVRRIIFGAM